MTPRSKRVDKKMTGTMPQAADDMIEFARRLLNVSKTEIDAIRKKQAGEKKIRH